VYVCTAVCLSRGQVGFESLSSFEWGSIPPRSTIGYYGSVMNHDHFILRCLELAAKADRTVGINPQVGALLVSKKEIVAEGWHRGFGRAHAEADLFEQINSTEVSKNFEDCTLYVNLEPCCHQGKTPPCTELIISSGIKTVVYGVEDPNPEVAGKGINQLRKAGIEVIGPILPERCRRLNRGYVSYRERGRPYITMKSAQTVNGEFIGKITSEEQDAWAHLHLRATHDAILVGVETILTDDPLLSTRVDQDQKLYTNYRLILDPKLRTPLDAKVITDPLASRTIVVTLDASLPYADVLRKRGVLLWEVPSKDGLFDLAVLWKHCFDVSDTFFGITSILVEGGPTTWTIFRLQGMRDEEVVLVGC
jgi:diaminohydroxyphosphoribosylaminopyrimidine deaminase / 5-amino-6-(5-phosphoribosylamino)uracil reductase